MLRGVVFAILKGRVAIRFVGMVSQGKSTPSNSYGVYSSFNYITDAQRKQRQGKVSAAALFRFTSVQFDLSKGAKDDLQNQAASRIGSSRKLVPSERKYQKQIDHLYMFSFQISIVVYVHVFSRPHAHSFTLYLDLHCRHRSRRSIPQRLHITCTLQKSTTLFLLSFFLLCFFLFSLLFTFACFVNPFLNFRTFGRAHEFLMISCNFLILSLRLFNCVLCS